MENTKTKTQSSEAASAATETTDKAPRVRNQRSIEDTLIALTEVETNGTPKNIRKLLDIGQQLKEDRRWWERRTGSLVESLKEAKRILERFEKVDQMLEQLTV